MDPTNPPPATSAEAEAHIEAFTQNIVREALGVTALANLLRGAKKFIEQAAREYADRFLLELLQNAYDAQPPDVPGRVAIIFDATEGEFGCLYVANTGSPFGPRNFQAICEIAQSSKRPGEGIGNKGVGFKSVVQVSQWPEIYSRAQSGEGFSGYCFRFATPEDVRRLVRSEAEANVLTDRLSPYGLPIHIPAAAHPPRIRDLGEQEFSSVIRLPLRTREANAIVQDQFKQLRSVDAPVLLFLDRLSSVSIEEVFVDGLVTSERHDRRSEPAGMDIAGVDSSVVTLGHGRRYVLLSEPVPQDEFQLEIGRTVDSTLVDESWKEWDGDARVEIALSIGDPRVNPHVGAPADPGRRLYCYLPMGERVEGPFAGHLNAPFVVTLARDGLVDGAALNAFLFDRAAGLAAKAMGALRDHASGRTAVPDLVLWDAEEADRIGAAFSATGVEMLDEELLPAVGPKPWASMAVAAIWQRPLQTLTTAALSTVAAAVLVDESIGTSRIARIQPLVDALGGASLTPRHEHIAEWVERLARHTADSGRRKPLAFDPDWWMSFYDDLAATFARGQEGSLRGRQILIDDELRLHATWGASGAVRTAIYFPMREVADDDAGPRDVSIPKTLSQHLAYLNAAIPWKSPNPQTGRPANRPGRDFLENGSLVRMPRTQAILERLADVLARSRDKQKHLDALRLVYNLTAVRSYTQSPKVSELHLRVPTTSGDWIPAEEAVFSASWPNTLGGELEQLIFEANGVSPDLEGLARRLVAQPDRLGFHLDSIDAWTTFLRKVGVGDGLQPVAVPSVSGDHEGSWWRDRIADHTQLPAADDERWRAVLQESTPPVGYPKKPHRLASRVVRMPASDVFDALPLPARQLYGRLVVASLGTWPTEVMHVEVARPGAKYDSDRFVLPSPAFAFLARAEWMPITRPGAAGVEDFVAPTSAWHYQENDAEAKPTFMPLVVTAVRRRIELSDRAEQRLRSLGMCVWGDRRHALRRLRALGEGYTRLDVAETLIANFRKAYERTWNLVVDSAGPVPEGRLGSADYLLVSRRGRLAAQAVADTAGTFVLVDEDRLVSAVLDATETAVLPVDPARGSAIATFLEEQCGVILRPVGADDVDVFVDGESVRELSGVPLLGEDRAWILDLVALALERKASAFNRQTHQRVQAALDEVRAMRLHAGSNVTIELAGEPVVLPGHLRQVFAVDEPGRPGIAYRGRSDKLDWNTLAMLAPKLGELVGGVETANAVESVVVSLARRLGGGTTTSPTDEDYSAVLEVPLEEIASIRKAHRTGTAGTAYVLRPVVAALVGRDVLKPAVDPDQEGPDAAGILRALAPYATAFPPHCQPADLLAAALSGASLPSLRDDAGIGFAEFNAVLAGLDAGYQPLTDPQAHRAAVGSYLATHRAAIAAELRDRAISEFDAQTIPKAYSRLSAELARAIERRSIDRDTWTLPLDPDPAWLPNYALPPETLIRSLVESWLGQLTGPIGAEPLPELESVRAANVRQLRTVIERARQVLPVWVAKNGPAEMPEWIDDTGADDETVRRVTRSGVCDFRPLDERSLIAWLRRLDEWPEALPSSLDLPDLGITPDDLRAQQDATQQAKWQAAVKRRSWEVDGHRVSLDPADVQELVARVRSSLTPTLLATAETTLDLMEVGDKRRGPGNGNPPGNPPRPPKRLTSDQTDLIGFLGELIVYEWLSQRYGARCLWRSQNRRHVIHDGDPGNDGLGFDIEVLRDDRPSLMYEVKATTSARNEFEMSETELRVAQQNASNDRYRIICVAGVDVSTAREILPLPNPMSARGRGRFRVVGRGIRYQFERQATEGA